MKKGIPESLSRPILRLISNSWRENIKKITTVTLVWISDSGGSREGAQGAQAHFLCLDQTDEAWMAKKNVFGDRSPPPLSKVWMTGAPLSQGLDPALSDTK